MSDQRRYSWVADYRLVLELKAARKPERDKQAAMWRLMRKTEPTFAKILFRRLMAAKRQFAMEAWMV